MTGNEPQSPIVKRLENGATASGGVDALLNVLKAGLATTPFCGGIASLMTDYIPSARFLRLETFAEILANDLRNMADQIHEERIQTDEFAFMFEKCFRGAAENPQKEKLDAFRGILVNSLIDTKVSDQEKEYFLNLVNNLTSLHIRLLRFMSEPQRFLAANSISPDRIQAGFSESLAIAMSGVSIEIIRSAFADLHRNGFLNTDAQIFETMTHDQGMKLIGDRATDFGKRFICFCSAPSE